MSCKASWGIETKKVLCLQMSPRSLCRPSSKAAPGGGEWVLGKLPQSSSWPSICPEATWLSQVGAVGAHGQLDPSGQRWPLPATHVFLCIFVLPRWFSTGWNYRGAWKDGVSLREMFQMLKILIWLVQCGKVGCVSAVFRPPGTF